MKHLLAALVIGLVACGGRAATPPAGIENRARPAPVDAGAPDGMRAEVDALVERWELCQHWAGEEPYDAARSAEIRRGVADSCPGNDETRAVLERRYADRPDVLSRLRALDE